MPSDPRLDAVRAALAPCRADYRDSAVVTAEEVRGLVAAAEASTIKEIDACERDLASQTNVMGVVLGRSPMRALSTAEQKKRLADRHHAAARGGQEVGDRVEALAHAQQGLAARPEAGVELPVGQVARERERSGVRHVDARHPAGLEHA